MLTIAVVLVTVGMVAFSVLAVRVAAVIRIDIADEKERGNLIHRRTMHHRVGRGVSQSSRQLTVQRAERVRFGWVTICVSRYPGVGLSETVEWFPLRWFADRRRGQLLRGERREPRVGDQETWS